MPRLEGSPRRSPVAIRQQEAQAVRKRRNITTSIAGGLTALCIVGSAAFFVSHSGNSETPVVIVGTAAPQYSGEVGSTIDALQAIDITIQKDPKKRDGELGKLRDLTIAYYKTQMGKMMPEIVDLYRRKQFPISFVDTKTLWQKRAECPGPIGEVEMFLNVKGEAYIAKELIKKDTPAADAFIKTLLALSFQSPPTVPVAPYFLPQVLDPVVAEKGFVAYIPDRRNTDPHKECYVTGRTKFDDSVSVFLVDFLARPVVGDTFPYFGFLSTNPVQSVLINEYGIPLQDMIRLREKTDYRSLATQIGDAYQRKNGIRIRPGTGETFQLGNAEVLSIFGSR